MNDRELMFLPAHEQKRLIVEKVISSVEMVEASYRRIPELEPQLNAFITLDEDGACRPHAVRMLNWHRGRIRSTAWCSYSG
ncbi:MAG: hypothetical protein Ct9H300mP19_01910 [Dehalococcoidia bacterium]|nr:MAG: hypothetical protein Ct9H300mP19_01910 [Dehalococcoidia bacterium]